MASKENQSGIPIHLKTDAKSVVAHQLKAPLAGIKSALEVVLSGDLGPLTKDQEEYLELTFDSVERIIILVKELLDVAQIDEDGLQLEQEQAQLSILVKEVVDRLKVFAEAKNTHLMLQIEDDSAISIDVMKVRQVVHNLVMNAILYNVGKGSVTVTLRRQGDQIIFSCSDNGIGIREQNKDKVFAKFYRSQKARLVVPDGSGLGLFISKAFIERSGGKIWFESKENSGTTFYFMLPIK